MLEMKRRIAAVSAAVTGLQARMTPPQTSTDVDPDDGFDALRAWLEKYGDSPLVRIVSDHRRHIGPSETAELHGDGGAISGDAENTDR